MLEILCMHVVRSATSDIFLQMEKGTLLISLLLLIEKIYANTKIFRKLTICNWKISLIILRKILHQHLETERLSPKICKRWQFYLQFLVSMKQYSHCLSYKGKKKEKKIQYVQRNHVVKIIFVPPASYLWRVHYDYCSVKTELLWFWGSCHNVII